MRYLALATDYDGTLAHHGRVDQPTLDALDRLAASGRKLILVTGRELDELLGLFPRIDLFELVVAENGALLYRPATQERKLLAEPPSERFVAELRRRQVAPLSIGGSIVATFHPHENTVLDTIRDLGLELQVIFNKDAVMVLPPNVNKASGLMAALEALGLSPHNVVAVGDAENDHAMLNLVEYSAAVANAIPMLKETADRTTLSDHGAGVAELIADLLADDLSAPTSKAPRHAILLGSRDNGEEVSIAPAGVNLLIAGSSGSGKSTLATGVLERLAMQGYQFCIIDPEGDYEGLEDAIMLGNAEHGPTVAEVIAALEKPSINVVVNLIGLALQDRPPFFMSLLPRLQELRAKTGRPHWILVDEAHHLMPADWEAAPMILTQGSTAMIYVTVHPDGVAPAVLADVNMIVALGEAPESAIQKFCEVSKQLAPSLEPIQLEPAEALLWITSNESNEPPFKLSIAPSKSEQRRHRRKYAEGELPPDRSFYFRGPEEKLNLRAQNLILFMQIADGVDDETWLHHLRQSDYSTWMRDCVKDEALSGQVREIERQGTLPAQESRRLVRAAIEERYTLPAALNRPR